MKYGFHLPIYRQQDIFAGKRLDTGTLDAAEWNLLTSAAFVLEPLVAHIRQYRVEERRDRADRKQLAGQTRRAAAALRK